MGYKEPPTDINTDIYDIEIPNHGVLRYAIYYLRKSINWKNNIKRNLFVLLLLLLLLLKCKIGKY
eukprot:UN04148